MGRQRVRVVYKLRSMPGRRAVASGTSPAPPSPSGWSAGHDRLQIEVAGIPMHRVEQDTLVGMVELALQHPTGTPLALGSVNLDHVYRFGVRAGEWQGSTPMLEWVMLVDGAPVARRLRAITGAPWPRLTGADLLPVLLSAAQRSGASVGFLGGPLDEEAGLDAAVRTAWPTLDIAGIWTPPRRVVENFAASQRLSRKIAAAGVDFLVVGLGKPRQEAWIGRHGPDTGARVLAAFGAAADFLAGRSKRAPEWMRQAGVEWAYRLGHEPRRLSRRYLVHGPIALRTLWAATPVITYGGKVSLRDGVPAADFAAPSET